MASDGEDSTQPNARNHRHSRFTAHQKAEAVLRVLKGESAEAVSAEMEVTIGRLERWKDIFVAAGSAELTKKRDETRIWSAKYSKAIKQWAWLLVALVGIVSALVFLMQRESPE